MQLLYSAFCPNCGTAQVVRAAVFDENFIPQLALAALPLVLILIITVVVNALEDRAARSAFAKRRKVGWR